MRKRTTINRWKLRDARLRCGDSSRSKNGFACSKIVMFGEHTAPESDPQSCREIGSRCLSSRASPSTLRVMRAFSKREAREFYRRLAETRPIPQTELEFINPFTLL